MAAIAAGGAARPPIQKLATQAFPKAPGAAVRFAGGAGPIQPLGPGDRRRSAVAGFCVLATERPSGT